MFQACFGAMILLPKLDWTKSISISHYNSSIIINTPIIHTKCVIDFDSTLKIILSLWFVLNIISNPKYLIGNIINSQYFCPIFLGSFQWRSVHPASRPSRPACVLAAKQQSEWCWKLKETKRFLTWLFKGLLRREVKIICILKVNIKN